MGKKKSKSNLKLTIQDLKDLGIIKTKRKRKRKSTKYQKKTYNMDGVKSSSNHMVGYGSSLLSNNPAQQLNNENMVMQRDANIKAIQNGDETRMSGNNHQLRQIEDNYKDVKGAITHLWNVNNHYGPKIEEIDDDENDYVDILGKNRNDYRFDSKDVMKSLSSDNFIDEGDRTPSMVNDVNEIYATPPQSAKPNVLGSVSIVKPFELRAGGGVTNKKDVKPYSPYFDQENEYDDLPDFIDDVDEVIPKVQTVVKQKEEPPPKIEKKGNINLVDEVIPKVQTVVKQKEEPPPKIEKKGNINLSIPKVDLQQMYASFDGQDLKMLSGQATVKALREAIRKLPSYKAILKYSKA